MARTALLATLAATIALRGFRCSRFVHMRAYILGAWCLAAASFAISGHVATAEPRWLTGTAIAVHGLAILFWLGALGPLVLALGRDGRLDVVRRFSAVAVPLVIVLILTGILLAAVQLEYPMALVRTPYGWALSAKLVPFAGLLALALHNRARLTPALAADEPNAATRLTRSIYTEVTVALAILALASGFRMTVPPRSAMTGMDLAGMAMGSESAMPEHIALELRNDAIMAMLELWPGRPGANEVRVIFPDIQGQSEGPLGVTLGFSMPAADIEPIRVDATRTSAGWSVPRVLLPMAAEWRVTLEVLVNDFEKLALVAPIDLSPQRER